MDYKALAKETVQELLDDVAEDKYEWLEAKFSDGVKIWKRKAADGHWIYKGDVLLETTPAQLDDFITPRKPFRVQWDKFLEKVTIVQELGDGLTINHHITKPALKGIISPRDTVDLVQRGETDEVIYYAATNIEHPSCPITPAYVRAINFPSGFVIFKQPVYGMTRWCLIFNSDLKLPSVVNWIAGNCNIKPTLMVEHVENMREGLAKIIYEGRYPPLE